MTDQDDRILSEHRARKAAERARMLEGVDTSAPALGNAGQSLEANLAGSPEGDADGDNLAPPHIPRRPRNPPRRPPRSR